MMSNGQNGSPGFSVVLPNHMCYSPVSFMEWELYDCNCALALGTTGLETLGFWIIHSSRELVNRTWKECKEMAQQTAVSEPISDIQYMPYWSKSYG